MDEFLLNAGKRDELKNFLDFYVEKFNQPNFIDNDPISVPHSFTLPQDIEIMAFWTSMLAWGNRKSIIRSALRLAELMDGAPYEFIVHHKELDRTRFIKFAHRTFNDTDAIYFIEFFQQYYLQHPSLEDAFARFLTPQDTDTAKAIAGFHKLFFDNAYAPGRTRKHIATPERKSTCKRMNMFLRWMVRNDGKGVDFGLWKKISPSQLLMPLDVHVDKVARHLGLIERKQTDWNTVLELSETMKVLDPVDPVKYDFALFGLGVEKYFT